MCGGWLTLGMRIVSTGLRAHHDTASFPRVQDGRRAPMTIDAHVLYTFPLSYVYRSPIDLRASTLNSTLFRCKNVRCHLLHQCLSHQDSNTSKPSHCCARGDKREGLLVALVMRRKRKRTINVYTSNPRRSAQLESGLSEAVCRKTSL